MKFLPTRIAGCGLLKPTIYHDHRGHFAELYNITRDSEYFPVGVQQISHAKSRAGVIRGLHFQYNPKMAKAIRILHGMAEVFVVDLRRKSSTYAEYVGVLLSAEDEDLTWLYVPEGLAVGYQALDNIKLEYLHTSPRNDDSAVTIKWNDPTINIEWELDPEWEPVLSEKDATGLSLQEWESKPESWLL